MNKKQSKLKYVDENTGTHFLDVAVKRWETLAAIKKKKKTVERF